MMVGPGSDILIMVSSYGPVAGTAITSIELVPPPPNDDFDAASLVTAVPFTDAFDTFYGTVAADPVPSCGPSGVFSPTVWYAITLRPRRRSSRAHTAATGTRGSHSGRGPEARSRRSPAPIRPRRAPTRLCSTARSRPRPPRT
jgi:hypothetical protein